LLLAILADERIDPRRVKSVLPDLRENVQTGNALVDSRFDELLPTIAADIDRRAAVRPFTWKDAFAGIFQAGTGFDVVVGNPPYARIQVLAEHLPDQLLYFQHPDSGFETTQAFNFDEYMLFVERGLQVLEPGGRLAYILPHRFMTSVAGRALRERLIADTVIERIVHFGHAQIFPGRATYTCLLRVRRL
jgi:tRNA1(Val) A37 N6-methylase TrmN6